MKINILYVIIFLSICGATFFAIFYGTKLNEKIDSQNVKINDLQQQILLNQQSVEIKNQTGQTPNAATKSINKNQPTTVAPSIKKDQPIESPDAYELRDLRRLADMRMLVSSQEIYYKENNKYLTTGQNNQIMPTSIGIHMATVPKDPGKGTITPCTLNGSSTGGAFTYCQLPNNTDTQKFCYYARLEKPIVINGLNYFYDTASQSGNFYRTTEPTTLDSKSETGCGHLDKLF